MKNKLFKSFISCLLIAVFSFSFCVGSFALPVSEDVGDHYIYDQSGKAIEAPVAYKAIYTISGYEYVERNKTFNIVDMFIQGDYLYLLNQAENSIMILDSNYNLVHQIDTFEAVEGYVIPVLNDKTKAEDGSIISDPNMTKANKHRLNNPSGIFVNNNGDIYVADTNNKRLVILNKDYKVTKVIQNVKVAVLGKDYAFKPLKVAIDNSGGLNIIAYAVNRGIMQFDDSGTFRQFIGTPKVVVDASEMFWRSIATEAQKKRIVTHVPTEYNNLTINDRGLIYATISALDAEKLKGVVASRNLTGGVSPIVRLNSSGLDTLRRTGAYAPIGDLDFAKETAPQIVDVAVDENNLYTLLDSRTGRFFTYDDAGNLLFMGGGSGSRFGTIKTATSLVVWGDHVIVSDTGNGSLVVFETTDYAKTIVNAVQANSSGNYEVAANLWGEVLSYNSNMYIAHIGMGNSEMRIANTLIGKESLDHYQKALNYYSSANEKTNYSKAFTQLQREELLQNFSLIFFSILILVIGLFVLYYVRKFKKKKERGA